MLAPGVSPRVGVAAVPGGGDAVVVTVGDVAFAAGVEWVGLDAPSAPSRGMRDARRLADRDAQGYDLCVVRPVLSVHGSGSEQIGFSRLGTGHLPGMVSFGAQLLRRWLHDDALRARCLAPDPDVQVLLVAELGPQAWYVLAFVSGWIFPGTDCCVFTRVAAERLAGRYATHSVVALCPESFEAVCPRRIDRFDVLEWLPGPYAPALRRLFPLRDPVLRRRGAVVAVLTALIAGAIALSVYVAQERERLAAISARLIEQAQVGLEAERAERDVAVRERLTASAPWPVAAPRRTASLFSSCHRAIASLPWGFSASAAGAAASSRRDLYGSYHLDSVICERPGLRVVRVASVAMEDLPLAERFEHPVRWAELPSSLRFGQGVSFPLDPLLLPDPFDDLVVLETDVVASAPPRAPGGGVAPSVHVRLARVFGTVFDPVAERAHVLTGGQASFLADQVQIGRLHPSGHIVWALQGFVLDVKADAAGLDALAIAFDAEPALWVETIEWGGFQWRVRGYASAITSHALEHGLVAADPPGAS